MPITFFTQSKMICCAAIGINQKPDHTDIMELNLITIVGIGYSPPLCNYAVPPLIKCELKAHSDYALLTDDQIATF